MGISSYPIKTEQCPTCLYLIKISVYRDEDRYFIGIGCDCQTRQLSDYYDDQSQARLDLVSLSWKE